MKPTDFAKNITNFLTKYLQNEKGASLNTVRAYKDTFVLLLTFLENEKKLKTEKLILNDITKDLVIDFLDWIQDVRKCSNSTRNLRLSAIHSFYKYVKNQNIENLFEIQKILSINKKKSSTKSVEYISIEAIKCLFKKPNLKTASGIRDMALLSLTYDTAARVQEIIDLTPSMINFNKPYTVKLIGKGNKARIIPVIEGQLLHLKQYLKVFKLDNPENRLHPLFFNSRKDKLTRAGITYILKKYVKKAREDAPNFFTFKVSCHTLRHSKAMHLLQAKVDILYIKDILGHASIQTTERYARADSKHKRLALEKAYLKVNSNVEPEWINNPDLISWLKKL